MLRIVVSVTTRYIGSVHGEEGMLVESEGGECDTRGRSSLIEFGDVGFGLCISTSVFYRVGEI